MKNYTLVQGNLLDSDAKYICHQCNCVTSTSSGIARLIFEKYPFSDIYSPRAEYSKDDFPLLGQEPGDILISGNGLDERYIINMFGQYYPGSPRYPDGIKDGFVARQNYFKDCLLKMIKMHQLESVAFPYNIGCGLAGGNWDVYEKLIDIFANNVSADVFVYQLKSDDE